MFEILQVQAVALREKELRTSEVSKGILENKIQISKAPKEFTNLLERLPLGYRLEAVVKRATRKELVLSLHFLGRDLEVSIKNLLGIEFKPGQKVVLTLIEKKPYVLKLSLPLARGHEIFSQLRYFFQSPLSKILSRFFNFGSLTNLITNSGLFYETKIARYLLGKESKENLEKDLKFKIFSLFREFKLDKPKRFLVALPLSRLLITKQNMPFFRTNLLNFLGAYTNFYNLSPEKVETIGNFLILTRERIRKKYPFTLKGLKYYKLNRPILLHRLEAEFYRDFPRNSYSLNSLKEVLEFIQFLQGWSVLQNYKKAVIPFTYKGKKFFLGLYPIGNRRNISLLWERGLIKLSYKENNPFQGELLMVFKDERTLERFKKHIEELKKELESCQFSLKDVKFAVAPNVEELFILDMADKEYSNFLEIFI